MPPSVRLVEVSSDIIYLVPFPRGCTVLYSSGCWKRSFAFQQPSGERVPSIQLYPYVDLSPTLLLELLLIPPRLSRIFKQPTIR